MFSGARSGPGCFSTYSASRDVSVKKVQEELEELGAEMRELKEDSRELVGTMRKLLRQEQAEEKQQKETLRGDNPPRGHERDHGGGESPRPHSRS